MPEATRHNRLRRWAGPAGAVLLMALGIAPVIGGIAIVVIAYPLIDGGGSSDGGVRLINSVVGVLGAVTGIAIAGSGLIPVASGSWALVRPGEVSLLVAAAWATGGTVIGLLLVLLAAAAGLPLDVVAIIAIPMAASLVAACLLGFGAHEARRQHAPGAR